MIVENGKYFLYKHTDLGTNIVFYIGIGTKRYKYDTFKCHYGRAFSKAARSKEWKNYTQNKEFSVEIILESDDYKFILQKEIEFIAFYGRIDKNTGTLVNLTDGGAGVPSRLVTQKTRDKMSLWQIGKKHSQKTKDKISESHKGIPMKEETKEKIKNSTKGIKKSESTKLKMKEFLKHRIISEQGKENMRKAREARKGIKPTKEALINLQASAKKKQTPILKLDLEYNIVSEFEGFRQAVKEEKKSSATINRSLKEHKRDRYGDLYVYKHEFMEKKLNGDEFTQEEIREMKKIKQLT